jgi:uncharacterized membrane protein YdbT with pleckstrin-like domain
MIKKEHIKFLKDNENITMVLHRHWIIFAFKILYLLALILSTWIIFWVKDWLIHYLGSGFFWGAMCLYWIFFLTFIFLSWVNDELDMFLITNERIIGIEQISPLSRKVSECSLDRVQEVNAEMSWVLQTIFNFGHVHIHTASEHSDMTVYYAPDPVENARKVNNAINIYRHKGGTVGEKV